MEELTHRLNDVFMDEKLATTWSLFLTSAVYQ